MPPHTQQQRLPPQEDGVALLEGRAGFLLAVHERRAATHLFHLDGDGRGVREELPSRDAVAREETLA
jgi:hypothetical protein